MNWKKHKNIIVSSFIIIAIIILSVLDYKFTVWGINNTYFEELNPMAANIINNPPIYLTLYKILITFGHLGLALAIYIKHPTKGRILLWISFITLSLLMIYWYFFFKPIHIL